jgi:acylpyruvate hydrolase
MIEDPQSVDLLLRINDKVVQSDSTSSMYYKIPFLIEFLSQYMTLNPGDLILTGTPHGVGPIRVVIMVILNRIY